MTFTVTYRSKDGALREERIEAVSRAECVAECRKRGIAPTKIAEGKGANRRDGARPSRVGVTGSGGDNKRTTARWVVVAVVVAAVAGGVWWWFSARSVIAPYQVPVKQKVAKPKAEKPAKTARAEQRPSVATNATAAAQPQPKPVASPKPFNPNEPPPGLLPNEPWRSGRKKLHKVQYVARNTNTVHRNSTEQALLDIFTCNVGDPPLPLTDLPKDDLTNMWSILTSPNPVTDKDAEEVKIAKETLEVAKREMAKFVQEGGKPDEFLSYYHGILEKAYKKRMLATEEIYKVLEEQTDPESARAMLKRVNADLRKEGIRPLPIPSSAFPPKEQEK